MKENNFEQFKKVTTEFSAESSAKKTELLKKCSLQKLPLAKQLQAYHNALLFTLAYPENKDVSIIAERELDRITLHTKKTTIAEKLAQSGIAFTPTDGAFSLTLTSWLLSGFPDEVHLHSFDEGGTHPREVLKHFFPEMEFELLSDEKLSPLKWSEKAAGTKNKNKLLKWLVDQFNSTNLPSGITEQLFEMLQLYISIKPRTKNFSRTFGRIQSAEIYYHNELVKKFNEQKIIGKKLPKAKKLTVQEAKQIIDTSRIALALLNRETDPVTYCNESGLTYYELEHGISIALFSMLPPRRLPLESYIGFMMFKNGYPMAYGGGWLFGKRSLLGINIFESFRGGESAFVFAQLLRTYHNAFGADYFEVEPYQFGKNNPEGIQSGAFWFYYRFGFRPVNSNLNKLSEEEAVKIKENKGYRSSFEILKKFTACNVGLQLKSVIAPVNPAFISSYISFRIATDFAGDREMANKKAKEFVIKKLKLQKSYVHSNKTGFGKLSLFYFLCLNESKLNQTLLKKLKLLIELKSNDETEYCKELSQLNINSILSLDCLKFISGLSAKLQV